MEQAGVDAQLLAALAVARQEVGAEGELFAFYERLLALLHSKKEALPPPPPVPEGGRTRTRAGHPALTWAALAVGEDFHSWLLTLAALFDSRDPGVMDEAEAIEAGQSLHLAERWFARGSTALGPTVDALFANALAPYLERAAAALAPLSAPDEWASNRCPACGGLPDFALWDEPASHYSLLCERCRTPWTLHHAGCLFCGEDDPAAYGFYSSEDDLYRLIVCDSCGHYLKSINALQARRAGLRPLLPAERLLTPGLDLLAAQEGYSRPTMDE